MDGRQEKSKHSTPPRILRTNLAQPLAAAHARCWCSMWEKIGSKEGVAVAVEAAADPRQVVHPGPPHVEERGRRYERTCADGGVGSHISTPPQRGGGEWDVMRS